MQCKWNLIELQGINFFREATENKSNCSRNIYAWRYIANHVLLWDLGTQCTSTITRVTPVIHSFPNHALGNRNLNINTNSKNKLVHYFASFSTKLQTSTFWPLNILPCISMYSRKTKSIYPSQHSVICGTIFLIVEHVVVPLHSCRLTEKPIKWQMKSY